MKALILSDIHGAKLRINKLIEKTEPDIIILPGDIPSSIDFPTLFITLLKRQNRNGYVKNLYQRFIDRINLKQIRSVKLILEELLTYNKPIILIHGNTETNQTKTWLKLYALRNPQIHYIADNHFKINDILFVGHGWVTIEEDSTRQPSPGEIDIETSKTILLDVLGRTRISAKKRILISHAPPYKTLIDYITPAKKHVGSKVIRTIMDTGHFDGVISGHLHESFGSVQMESWWGVNAGAAVEDTACLIDLESNQIKWIHQIIGKYRIESIIYKMKKYF